MRWSCMSALVRQKDGIVRGIDLYTLSNTGAYGEHGPTTVGLSGHKSIPLYGKAEAFRFVSDVVYTNHMSSGAYRGYGATQGLFAVESAVNELADKLGIDPFVIRQRNIIHEGDVMPAYYGQVNTSCALDRCLQAVHDNIGWDAKSTPCATWVTARCALWAWAWRCRAPALRVWMWAAPA